MSAEMYRLPLALGGRTVVGEPVDADVPSVVVVIDHCPVVLPLAVLTLIAEPEPGAGAWVVIRLPDSGQWLVFHHVPQDSLAPWYCHDTGNRTTWSEVRTLGEVVHLRPAPLGPGAYGRCTGCGTDRPLTNEGRIKQHGSRHRPCSGSAEFPAKGGA